MSCNTRDRIIEESFLLFLRKGFKAVTLDEIEQTVKITRGTFYYHFMDKAEVVKEGLERYYKMIDAKREKEFGSISTLREFVDLAIAKLQHIENYTARNFDDEIPEVLCLSLIAEVMSIYPEFKLVVETSKNIRIHKLEQLINKAILHKELKSDIDATVLAENFMNIGVGVINYLVMHQDIDIAISQVKAQYDQLYWLASNK